jgi:hypothetical protein
MGYDNAGENPLVLFHLFRRRYADGDRMVRKFKHALDITGVKTSVDESHGVSCENWHPSPSMLLYLGFLDEQ